MACLSEPKAWSEAFQIRGNKQRLFRATAPRSPPKSPAPLRGTECHLQAQSGIVAQVSGQRVREDLGGHKFQAYNQVWSVPQRGSVEREKYLGHDIPQ